MKLLLDTHALLWAVSDEKKLSEDAKSAIAAEENVVFASLVSLWEIQIKESIGKIKLPKSFFRRIVSVGFELLPISLTHIETLRKLPHHHRDPFDRMLIAQAETDQLTLVTRDDEIRKYDVKLLMA